MDELKKYGYEKNKKIFKERYKNDEEFKKKVNYKNLKSYAKRFLTKMIKEEDKAQFKKYLEEL